MKKLNFLHDQRIVIGPASGSLEVSRCGIFATPHISVPQMWQRQGWATKLVNEMYAIAESEGLTIMWEDEPGYMGNGWLTPNGQAFADSYRTRKGLPLPEFHYVDYCKQPRG